MGALTQYNNGKAAVLAGTKERGPPLKVLSYEAVCVCEVGSVCYQKFRTLRGYKTSLNTTKPGYLWQRLLRMRGDRNCHNFGRVLGCSHCFNVKGEYGPRSGCVQGVGALIDCTVSWRNRPGSCDRGAREQGVKRKSETPPPGRAAAARR